MHATRTVHAVPDLRIAGGRFGGRVSCHFSPRLKSVCTIDEINVLMTRSVRRKCEILEADYFLWVGSEDS